MGVRAGRLAARLPVLGTERCSEFHRPQQRRTMAVVGLSKIGYYRPDNIYQLRLSGLKRRVKAVVPGNQDDGVVPVRLWAGAPSLGCGPADQVDDVCDVVGSQPHVLVRVVRPSSIGNYEVHSSHASGCGEITVLQM
jgi:hypothetical protein